VEDRQSRERRAHDEDGVTDKNNSYYRRFSHVTLCPNSARGDALFNGFVKESATGGRVLDLCCGTGLKTRQLLELGPKYVLGIDLSEAHIATAKLSEQPGSLEFVLGDVSEPLEGQFDLIVGRGALHHIDFRPILINLSLNNLSPGGMLLFEEPLGENLITRAFHRFVPSAHTPDERPLRKSDIEWFLTTFPESSFHAFNYLSYPIGLFTSLFMKSPNNRLLRCADWIDLRLEHLNRIRYRFRLGILVATVPSREFVA
jgi:SAM-dependent methyltransferase